MASHDQNPRNSVGFEGDEAHLGASVHSSPPPPVHMFCLNIGTMVSIESSES